ncbi:MAG: YceI family protein [Steroidobacteraceae bacterium]|nr:YceI family protein [Steroidobacteraceae bacterium]
MPWRKIAAVAALTALIAGCYSPAPRPGAASSAAPAPAAANLYRIDARRSSLRILVYRAGPMAALGHDHVITNDALSGWIRLARPLTASTFRIVVPAASFVVDDAAARRAAGPDFASTVSASAKQGTRKHMLGSALLDARRYPLIVVRSIAIDGEAPRLRALMAVRVAGHEARISVPFEFKLGRRRVVASASFALRQTTLGLTPYSVMLGALRVRDEIRLKIAIVAKRRREHVAWNRFEPVTHAMPPTQTYFISV